MKKNNNTYRILAYFTQFTVNMLVPIFLCSFAGYELDKKLGTSFIFIIMFFIGALAGFRNVYILAKRFIKGTDEESDS